MKRLAVAIGLMLAPTGLCAQGLPIDFDADAFENPAPRVDIAAAAPARIVDMAPLRRSVRHGERTLAIDGDKPAVPPALKIASRDGG